LAFAIDLDDRLAILLEPGVAQCVLALADGNNLSPEAKDSGVFDNAEFLKFLPTADTGPVGTRLQRQKLADIDQQQSGLPAQISGWAQPISLAVASALFGLVPIELRQPRMIAAEVWPNSSSAP